MHLSHRDLSPHHPLVIEFPGGVQVRITNELDTDDGICTVSVTLPAQPGWECLFDGHPTDSSGDHCLVVYQPHEGEAGHYYLDGTMEETP